MPSDELLREAERQITVCNACRYCEGFCAVFPAMESRRNFANEDLIYLANLCFDCRACYHACQFTPPHEYDINVPAIFSSIRVETYRDYTGSRVLAKLFQGNWQLIAAGVVGLIAFVLGLTIAVQGTDVVFEANPDEGSFFEVIPYYAMVIPALILSAMWVGALAIGGIRFWRNTGGSLGEMVDGPSFWKATKDAFGMEYLKGGGVGCNYPTGRPNQMRRWMHHAVFYGILFDTASTTVAAVYHNFLGRDAPYAWTSWPVVLGLIGGVLVTVGALGLLYLKPKSEAELASKKMMTMDVVFLWLLVVVSVTGIVLLGVRETAAMGTMLAVHLALVGALFLTLPYGKFAHVVYRYAALIRYQIELAREEKTGAHA